MSDEKSTTTRRTFVKSAIASGVTVAALAELGCATSQDRRAGAPQSTDAEAGAAAAAAGAPPKYPDLRIAYIGTGGIGGYHFENTVEHGVQCPCFCDVDRREWGNAAKHFPNARGYQDYREMFDKEQRNFDAVMIGVPDHHHYPASIIAMQLGKHVYTQKPLTHTVWEARQLTEAARKYKVATQMGNQGHALEGWRLVYEFVHSGKLGRIQEVHTWTDRPIWPQGIERPEGEDAVPPELNWDVWVGPAPMRPYVGPKPGERNGPYHRFNWRAWWDFGCGALGDMACHTMDGLFWALNPPPPRFVEPICATPITPDAFPNASGVRWEFPGTWGRPGFTAYWYDGGLRPPLPSGFEIGRKLPGTGNLFVGSKASLLVSGDYGESPRVVPETKHKEIGRPPRMLERSPGHVLEWLMACVGEKPLDYPKSNFFYAGPMTETILLGNVALRMGRRLEWDSGKLEFRNMPEANAFVSKEYRAGWKF